MFYYDTTAQTLVAKLPTMGNEIGVINTIMDLGGVLIAKIKSPDFRNIVTNQSESPPDELMFYQYQFADGSLIWYTKQGGQEFIQLRGVYARGRIHTAFSTAGEPVVYLFPDYKGFPDTYWRHVNELNLTVRVQQVLRLENIEYIGQLIGMTEKEFKAIPNLGKTSFNVTKEALTKNGLKFGTNTTGWPRPI